MLLLVQQSVRCRSAFFVGFNASCHAASVFGAPIGRTLCSAALSGTSSRFHALHCRFARWKNGMLSWYFGADDRIKTLAWCVRLHSIGAERFCETQFQTCSADILQMILAFTFTRLKRSAQVQSKEMTMNVCQVQLYNRAAKTTVNNRVNATDRLGIRIAFGENVFNREIISIPTKHNQAATM